MPGMLREICTARRRKYQTLKMQEKACGCLLPPLKIIGNKVNGSPPLNFQKQVPTSTIIPLQNAQDYPKLAEREDKLIIRQAGDSKVCSERRKLDENIIRHYSYPQISDKPEYSQLNATDRRFSWSPNEADVYVQRGKATGYLIHSSGYMRWKKSSTSSDEEDVKVASLSQNLKVSAPKGLALTDLLSKRKRALEFPPRAFKRSLSSSNDNHDVPEKKFISDIDIVTTQNENRMMLDRILTTFRKEMDRKLTIDPRDIDYQPHQSSIWGVGRAETSARLPLSHITEKGRRYPMPRYSTPRLIQSSLISDKLWYHHPVIVDNRSQNYTITSAGQAHSRHGFHARLVNDHRSDAGPSLKRTVGLPEPGQENYNFASYSNIAGLHTEDADWSDDVFYPAYARPTVLRDVATHGADEVSHSSDDEYSSSTETLASNSPTSEQPPRKTRKYNCFHLWEFLRDTLNDETMQPKCMEWTDKSTGEFRLINPARTAALWGSLKTRRKGGAMSYEKMARAMRFYYKKNILEKVPDKKLHFRFSKDILQQVIGSH